MRAAVLVAIAIPIFTSQLEKAREATDASNVRAMYAEITSGYLTGELQSSSGIHVGDNKAVTWNGTALTATVDYTAVQQKDGWVGDAPKIGTVALGDLNGATKIVYTFQDDTDGDLILKSVTKG